MPIPSDLYPAIEGALNRLAVESVLANPGRDEGLIPAYSLLGELRDLVSTEPAMRGAIDALLPDLEKCLDAGRPFDAALVERLRALVEWLPGALAELAAGRTRPEVAARREPEPDGSREAVLRFDLGENRELLTEFHHEASDHLLQIEAAVLALERQPDDPEALNSIFRSFHTIKGNAGFLGLAPMHALAHEIESLLDLARKRRLRLNPTIVTSILRGRDALLALNRQIEAALEDGRQPEAAVAVGGLIAEVRSLAAGASPAGGEGPGGRAAGAGPAEGGPGRKGPGAGGEAPAQPVPAVSGPSRTVRVATEKLDSLMDVVGELVIVQSQLLETARRAGGSSPPLQRDVAQLARITKELQNTAMSLRMIPIKPVFQKMERLARDLAGECGKRVNFTTSGEDTELDRTVVEEIGDPLVHMVRNALDHGLEPPEERQALGKPEAGEVRLRACYQGGSVVVELQDDGRGIDPEKVLARARRLGLAAADAALSREEILGLIFLPGFSTAEKVTAVSGRGVGMDVVKRNIEKLRGKIEISSEVGRGSIFQVKLPLTMAIIDGLIVRVGDDRFILPSTSVQMALRPTRENVVRVQGSGEVLELHGRLMPLHRLNRRFGIPARAREPWDGIVVILESSGRVCALLVDEMLSKQEVVIKNLGGFFQGLPGVAGGAILGDGGIALILDPAALLQAA